MEMYVRMKVKVHSLTCIYTHRHTLPFKVDKQLADANLTHILETWQVIARQKGGYRQAFTFVVVSETWFSLVTQWELRHLIQLFFYQLKYINEFYKKNIFKNYIRKTVGPQKSTIVILTPLGKILNWQRHHLPCALTKFTSKTHLKWD